MRRPTNRMMLESTPALAGLTPTQLRRFQLFVEDGKSFREIAEIEHCKYSTVKDSIDAAKKHIKKFCAYRLNAAGHKIDARVRSIGQLMCYNDLRKRWRSLAWQEQSASRFRNFVLVSAQRTPAGRNYCQ